MTTDTHSPELDKLAAALVAAQAKLSPAIKSSVNPHFRSKYADLSAVWEAARPVLSANGLSVLQTFSASNGETVTVNTTLLHVTGQWITSALTLKPAKADPQGIGSAITYGRRYGLSSLLGIVADEDDDGNAASRRGQTQKQAPATNWKDFVIHWGKNEGRTFGELTPAQLDWYQKSWYPKPSEHGEVDPQDQAMREALDASIIATARRAESLPPKAAATGAPKPEPKSTPAKKEPANAHA